MFSSRGIRPALMPDDESLQHGCSGLNKRRTVGMMGGTAPNLARLSFAAAALAAIVDLRLDRAANQPGRGMIRMRQRAKYGWVIGGLGLMALSASAASADDYKLVSNQRISCGRGLSAGKLSTATCRSFAYLFNIKTSEYFRCAVSVSMTRDAKEIINVQSDGGCVKKPRVFDTDSNYSFDATETEPPNTNSFFGTGGYAVWASDNTAQKVRGCIIIASGLGSDVSKCLDMKFD
jgi:hypothetical protein